MLNTTVYGYANEEEVEVAIKKRLADTNADSKEALAALLGESIAVLLDINASIPHFSKHRHLIAGALEVFADKQNGSED
jgi:hypothetical protein